MYPPELEQRILEWRQKVADGTITKEDMKEFIPILRAGRLTAMTQPKEKKPSTRKKKTTEEATNLMKQLEGKTE